MTGYQFAYYLETGHIGDATKRTALNQVVRSPTLNIKLPKPSNLQNSLIIELRVFDAKGGYRSTTQVITLQALTISSVTEKQAIANDLLIASTLSSVSSAEILQNVKLATSLLSRSNEVIDNDLECPCINGECSDLLNPSKCVCSSGLLREALHYP